MRGSIRRIGLGGAILGLVAGSILVPVAVPVAFAAQTNPDLAPSCGIDVVVVLDESGSVGGNEGDVKSATLALLNGLNGTGSRVRFVEFSTNARDVSLPRTGGNTLFRTVDSTLISQVTTYFDNDDGSGAITYEPGGFTNWEAGLREARSTSADTGNPLPDTTLQAAPLVVFITDGVPNTIGNTGSSTEDNGGGASNSAAQAVDEMRALQTVGHVLGIAVGDGISDNTNFNRLRDLIETPGDGTLATVWNGTGTLDMRTTDVLRVTNFSNLPNALSQVVFALCAPSLSITKVDQAGQTISGWDFTATVDVLPPTGTDKQFEWVKPSPNAIVTGPNARTATTDAGGTALFQWTPKSVADPQTWNSTVSFTETLPAGWTVNSATTNTAQCTVKRLGAADIAVWLRQTTSGSTVTFTLHTAQTGGSAFQIQKSDIVTCKVTNNRPGQIKLVKQTLPNQTAGSFPFTISPSTGWTNASPSLADDGEILSGPIPAGTQVTITEGAFPIDGWELDSINCGQVNLPNKRTVVTVQAGVTTTCTFTNKFTVAPNIEVTKTALPTSFQEPAASVTYSVSVKNLTAEPIAAVTALTDAVSLNGSPVGTLDLSVDAPAGSPAGGTVTANTCDDNVANKPIAANATLSCTFTVSYVGRDTPDVIADTVSATARDRFNRTVTKTASASVNVTDLAPDMTLDKQNVGDVAGDVTTAGGTAKYKVIVTNPVSAKENLIIASFTDQLSRDAAGAPVNYVNIGSPLNIATVGGSVTATTCGAIIGTSLAPGASYTCEFSVAIGSGVLVQGDSLRNTITVTGRDDDNTTITLSDTADRGVSGVAPSIGVSKSDGGASILEPGQNITYTVDVYNRGTTEKLTIDKITDTIQFFANSGATGAARGAVVIGNLDANPGVDVDSSTLSGGVALVSTTCGSLIGTQLDKATALDSNGVPTNAGARAQCVIVLNLPANASDKYSDVVKVEATDEVGPNGQAPGDKVSGENGAETPAADQKPTLSITKTPNPTEVPETGGSVTFTFEITNTSPASSDPVTLTALLDDVLGDLFGTPAAGVTTTCAPLKNTVLAKGASTSCTATTTLKGNVGAPHVNNVSVTGKDDENNEAKATAKATVDFIDVLPSVTIAKTDDGASVAEPGGAPAGNVTYSLTITNTSDEPVAVTELKDVVTYATPASTVTIDLLAAPVAPLVSSDCQAKLAGGLDPGQVVTCSFVVTLGGTAQTVNDTVTIVVRDDEQSTATDDASESTPITDVAPTIFLEKTEDGPGVDEPGGTVTYSVQITNESTFDPLTITKLEDVINLPVGTPSQVTIDLLQATGGVTGVSLTANSCLTQLNALSPTRTLAPGATVNCTFAITYSGRTAQLVSDTLTVVAQDDDPGGTDPSATSNADTPIKDVAPTVEIVKTASPTRILPGADVTYTFTVFNRSTIEPIKVLALNDPKIPALATTGSCNISTWPWLTPADGDDTAGTDQYTCTITVAVGASLDPFGTDVNTVTVEAGDDEIVASESGEQGSAMPRVTDTDDATVDVRKPGSITVIKQASGLTGPFTFTLNGKDEQTIAAGEDTSWINLDAGATADATASYTLAETGVPANTEVLFSCESDGSQAGDVTDGVSRTINLSWGEDVTCTVTNTKLGPVEITKTLTSGPTRIAGTNTYDALYTIEVENTSFRDETFDLADSLGLTSGVTAAVGTIGNPDGIALNPAWNGTTVTQLTDGDETIPARATYTLTIPVVFTLDPTVGSSSLDCVEIEGVNTGGAANNVSMTSSAGDQKATACDDFGAPDLEYTKSISESATVTDGVWAIEYQIVVENNGDAPTTYVLEDEFLFGDEVQVQTVATSVTTTGQTAPAAPTNASLNSGFDGVDDTTVIGSTPIVGGATHTYTIAVTATIPLPDAGENFDGACADPDEPDTGGFGNRASIVGGTSDTPYVCEPYSTLTLSKDAETDDGGNLGQDDFTLTAAGPVTFDGAGFVRQAVPAGTYQLSESPTDVGYLVGEWRCWEIGGDDLVVELGSEPGTAGVKVPEGADVFCRILNDDLPVDLGITKTGPDGTVLAGSDPFTYTITVTNNGERDADLDEQVTLSDLLPDELTWITIPTGDGYDCAQDEQLVTCEIDPALLGAGESVTLTATVKATADVPAGVYVNKAWVDTQDDPVCPEFFFEDTFRATEEIVEFPIDDCVPPPCPRIPIENGDEEFAPQDLEEGPKRFLNVACEPTVIDTEGDLEVVKVDSKDPVVNGETFTYSITVTNTGPSNIQDVRVTDPVPAGLTLVGVPSGANWDCTASTSTLVDCDYIPASLSTGSTAPITLTVTVQRGFVGDQIINVATATGTLDKGPENDPEPVDGTDEETTNVTRTIDASALTEQCIDDTPYIKVDVDTLGFSPTLDADGFATVTLRFIGSRDGGTTFTEVVETRTLKVKPDSNGDIRTQTLYPGATIDPVTGEPTDWPGWIFRDGAWFTDPTDAFVRDGLLVEVTINPTSTALVEYPPATEACASPEQTNADLAIVKTASLPTVGAGENFDWVLTVTNNGPDPAGKVVVTDPLLGGRAVSVSSTDFTCTLSSNVVTCTRDTLAVGATGQIIVRMSVPAATPPGALSNTATVTATTPDPTTGNNTSTASITIVGSLPPPPPPPPATIPPTGSNITQLLLQLAAMIALLGGAMVLADRGRRRRRAV